MRCKHMASLLVAGTISAFTMALPARADVVDPLYGFCWGSSSCSTNGTNTPTTAAAPNFGFYIGPNAKTGDDLSVAILVPNNELSQAPSGGFGITGSFSGTATQYTSSTYGSQWVNLTPSAAHPLPTPYLSAFLGLNAPDPAAPGNPVPPSVQPNNYLGALLPATQTLDAGATGFYVFFVNLTGETQTSLTTSAGSGNPEFTLSQNLPLGSYILGFFDPDATNGIAVSEVSLPIGTANYGAILETSDCAGPNGCVTHRGPAVPEPSPLLVMGGGLAALGLLLIRRKAA